MSSSTSTLILTSSSFCSSSESDFADESEDGQSLSLSDDLDFFLLDFLEAFFFLW